MPELRFTSVGSCSERLRVVVSCEYTVRAFSIKEKRSALLEGQCLQQYGQAVVFNCPVGLKRHEYLSRAQNISHCENTIPEKPP